MLTASMNGALGATDVEGLAKRIVALFHGSTSGGCYSGVTETLSTIPDHATQDLVVQRAIVLGADPEGVVRCLSWVREDEDERTAVKTPSGGAAQRQGNVSPLGYVPSYAIVLGAPMVTGAVMGVAGSRSGKGAALGALGGLIGGGVIAMVMRSRFRLDM